MPSHYLTAGVLVTLAACGIANSLTRHGLTSRQLLFLAAAVAAYDATSTLALHTMRDLFSATGAQPIQIAVLAPTSTGPVGIGYGAIGVDPVNPLSLPRF